MAATQKVFGVDLGTTYSAVALVDEYGVPQVIENEDGQLTTPSVVYFESADSFVVGLEAKNGMKVYPDETVSLIKRHMGDRISFNYHGKEFTPEAISALILRQVVEVAQEMEDEESNAVVITVPAYFGTVQKQATKDAGEIAGLDVRGIIAEPVAAALAAGFEPGSNQTLFVYDLGGGTMDCTVMEFNDTGIEVLATDGDRRLGGADWDAELLQMVAADFMLEAGLDENPLLDDRFYQDLVSKVEQAKISLSKKKKAKITCTYQNLDPMVIEVTREAFEERTRDKVEQTLRIVDRTLEKAREKRPDLQIDKYLLVGGSSKMPMISQALEERYGWTFAPSDYDLAVAKGAAIYGQGEMDFQVTMAGEGGDAAAPTPGEKKQFILGDGAAGAQTITNVLPKSVGVLFFDPETKERFVGHILHAGEALPAEATSTAYTVRDNTTSVRFRIFEQLGEVESKDLDANEEISPEGGAVLDNLPNLPANSRVELILSVDADGIVTLTGHEPVSGQNFILEAQVSAMDKEEVAEAKDLIGLMRRGD